MTNQTALITGLTTAISARDFTPAKDHRRIQWNSGAMRHVIAALAGTPVMIITDAQTGSTQLGAILKGVRHGRFGNSDELLVEYQGRITAFKLFTIGETIVPLVDETGTTSAKWHAIASYRIEGSKAVAKACAEHGASEGREWGTWSAKLFIDTAQVTYTPSVKNPHFVDKAGERGFWEYSLSDLS